MSIRIPEVDWIFFDLDGTLWDHASASRHAIMEVCGRYGLPPMNFLAAFKSSNEHLWGEFAAGRVDFSTLRVRRFEMVLQQMACGCSSNDAQEISEFYLENYLGRPSILPGAVECLRQAARRARLAILTNGAREIQAIKMAQFGGDAALVEFMICAEDVDTLKPAPAFYAEGVRRAGGPAPSRILMVGDSWNEDVIMPCELGWSAIWLSHGQGIPEDLPSRAWVLPGIEALSARLRSSAETQP